MYVFYWVYVYNCLLWFFIEKVEDGELDLIGIDDDELEKVRFL